MHIYIRKTPADHLLSSVATQGCSHTPQAVFLYLHLRRTPCHIRVFGRPSSRRLRLHSPVDRGGNGNTPCMRPVKRQFPRDTPLLRTAHCYAFLIRHTNTHTQSGFQQSFKCIRQTALEPGTQSQLLYKSLFIKTVTYIVFFLCYTIYISVCGSHTHSVFTAPGCCSQSAPHFHQIA